MPDTALGVPRFSMTSDLSAETARVSFLLILIGNFHRMAIGSRLKRKSIVDPWAPEQPPQIPERSRSTSESHPERCVRLLLATRHERRTRPVRGLLRCTHHLPRSSK